MKLSVQPKFLLNGVDEDKLKTELKTKNDKKLKKACLDFEAFFLDMVFTEMKKTLPGNALFPDTNAKKIFDYMYMDALTKNAVKNQSIGIGDMLYNFLKKFD